MKERPLTTKAVIEAFKTIRKWKKEEKVQDKLRKSPYKEKGILAGHKKKMKVAKKYYKPHKSYLQRG